MTGFLTHPLFGSELDSLGVAGAVLDRDVPERSSNEDSNIAMKNQRRFKQLVYSLLLGLGLAIFAPSSVNAAWAENNVTGDLPASESLRYTQGAYDAGYGVYWCTTGAGKLYAVYWNGSAWTSKLWASNVASGDSNMVGLDTAYHWVYYRGTDGYIWICYYTGSTWNTVKVSSNLNTARQLCVHSGWHVLYYVDSSGYLWALYYNGSGWTETKIDGTNQRYFSGRCCGVDEVYGFIWNMTSDRKSLRYTYYNGSAWTSTTMGTLAGTDLYYNICVDGPTHQIYNLQVSNTGFLTQLLSHYWDGSGWASWTCMKDGNLPTNNSEHYCVPSPNPYSCYLAKGASTRKVLFTNYSANARNWTTCRQDNDTMGGGDGLYPVVVGHDGRSVLCWKNAGGASVIFSSL